MTTVAACKPETPAPFELAFLPYQHVLAACPNTVKLSDLDGDGRVDIVSTCLVQPEQDNGFYVSRNVETVGGITSFLRYQQFQCSGPAGLAIGDLNGDGRPELFGAVLSSQNVCARINVTTTPGTFVLEPQLLVSSLGVRDVEIADFNADGRPDLVTANGGPIEAASVLFNATALGSTTLAFHPRTNFSFSGAPYGLAVGDLNHDGRPDFVLAGTGQTGTQRATFFINETPASGMVANFRTGDLTSPSLVAPFSAAVADLNKDGMADVVLSETNVGLAHVFLNTGPGDAFVAAQDLELPGLYHGSIEVADLNGDSKPDVVVANGTDHSISVFLNHTTNGAMTPTFATRRDFPVGGQPGRLAIGDLNGDGRPDLAATMVGAVSILTSK